MICTTTLIYVGKLVAVFIQYIVMHTDLIVSVPDTSNLMRVIKFGSMIIPVVHVYELELHTV